MVWDIEGKEHFEWIPKKIILIIILCDCLSFGDISEYSFINNAPKKSKVFHIAKQSRACQLFSLFLFKFYRFMFKDDLKLDPFSLYYVIIVDV